MKNISVNLLLLFMFCSVSFAQSQVDISAQLRARGNYENRDFNNDIDPYTFTELRSRIGLDFNAPMGIEAFFQIQDSRVYGTEPTTLTDTKNLDIHQAYAKVNDIFKLPIDVKFGRMEVKFANERLIGAVGWSNVGRSFDGGIATLKTQPVDLHMFGFHVDEQFRPSDSLDNIFAGVWANLNLSRKYVTDLFILHESIFESDALTRTTLGFYVMGDLGSFKHEVEFAYQLGEITTGGINQDVSSLMFAINASYNFEGTISPRISGGVDYLSGDDNPGDDEYGSFNTLYATNHKFYGYMDYFTNLPAHTMGLGLMDAHGSISVEIIRRLSLELKYHFFSSTEDYSLVNGSTSKNFGSEFDLTAKYQYSENLGLQLGASLFSPGDIFKETRGDDTSFWSYLMATVNL